jgi:AcrR family transcriptional regulator
MEQKGVVANARERVRDAVRSEIVAAAREQMAVEGAGALSLRAVARQLGMASSAVYRYFKSRDDLLTALIIDAYDDLGSDVEAAVAGSGKGRARWEGACRAVRRWALGHPHEYTLIYGSPVPGYQAPELTVGPASRVILALAGVLVDAQREGEIEVTEDTPLPSALEAQIRTVAELAAPDVPLTVLVKSLVAWTQLFGEVNFELFGQLHGIVSDPADLFEYAIETMSDLVGFIRE